MTERQTAFSSGVLPDHKRGCTGMAKGSILNQGGPSHHSECSTNSLGDRPREAQSAGFSSVGT